MVQELKREQLGDFLRSRRAQLQPEDVGLPRGKRRRSSGLRQDEVALLAGVSHSWYAWLEQGREINVSQDVLNSLARTLRLSTLERQYLHELARDQLAAPEKPLAVIPPQLRRFLDSQLYNPSTITDAHWNILAWNAANTALFGDTGNLPPDQRNKIRLVFTEPKVRRLVQDWEGYARCMLEQFRMAYATLEDEKSHHMVTELHRISPEFAAWWSEHDIRAAFTGEFTFLHPVCGAMTFESNAFQIASHPYLFAYVYVPVGDTVERMVALMASFNSASA
jgi:transcriptional regulator with XRE-family HTH domain